MRKKIYLFQPTHRDMKGKLIKGKLPLFNYSCTLPALSASIPDEWEKEICLECFDEVDLETDAPVVGIISTGNDILRTRDLAWEFKKRDKTVFFGGHILEWTERVLRGVCDAVYRGLPGPKEISELLEDISSGKVRAAYEFDLNIDFPFDYSFLRGRRIWFTPLIASVGCRNSCGYCAVPPLFCGGFSLRGVDTVIGDLRQVRAMRRTVAFMDANLYNDRVFLGELCRRIIRENMDLIWGARCTIDIADDPETLSLMRRAGCRILFLGLDSLDQRNLDWLRKPYSVERYTDQINAIRTQKMHVGGLFVIGLDWDTPETADRLHRFIRRSRIAVPKANIMLPIPGSAVYEQLRQEGRIWIKSADDYLRVGSAYSSPSNYSYFVPRRMSIAELERGYAKLMRGLGTVGGILWRSLVPNPLEALALFLMNLEVRKVYRAVRSMPARPDKEVVERRVGQAEGRLVETR